MKVFVNVNLMIAAGFLLTKHIDYSKIHVEKALNVYKH